MDSCPQWFKRRKCWRKSAGAILGDGPGYPSRYGTDRSRQRQGRNRGAAFQEMTARCKRTRIRSWFVHDRERFIRERRNLSRHIEAYTTKSKRPSPATLGKRKREALIDEHLPQRTT